MDQLAPTRPRSAPRPPVPHMTADDFLAWPGDGTGRTFQLVDGEVRAVSPASEVHATIQARMAFLLARAIKAARLPLRVLTEGALIPGLNAGTNVRVPDLLVASGRAERGRQTVPEPVLVVEVLSPGNADDTRDTIRALSTLPGVREMAVLHSTRVLAEVHRRDPATGAWRPDPEYVGPGEVLRLPSAGLGCVLDEAYEDTWLAPEALGGGAGDGEPRA